MFHTAKVLLIAIFAGFIAYKNSLFHLPSALAQLFLRMRPIIFCLVVLFRIPYLHRSNFHLYTKFIQKTKYIKWKHLVSGLFLVGFSVFGMAFLLFFSWCFEQCLCLYCCFLFQCFTRVFFRRRCDVGWNSATMDKTQFSESSHSGHPYLLLIGTFIFLFFLPCYCYSNLCVDHVINFVITSIRKRNDVGIITTQFFLRLGMIVIE